MEEKLMMLNQEVIVDNVKRQLAELTPDKYGWKRTPHKALMRLSTFLSYALFSRKKWDFGEPNVDLGIDEFGRSVFEGMKLYVNILNKRGIKLNTVLVQGSRVKGKWKPTSDIDVTIISEDFPRKKGYPQFFNKLHYLKTLFRLTDIPLGMGVEPSFCCTKKDFMAMLEDFDVHALDAIYYGKIIYDDGFWKDVKNKFKQIEIKYELDKTDLKKMLFVV